MLGLSVLQGLVLAGLWLAFDRDTWLAETPVIFVPLWTAAVAWPVLVLLVVEVGSLRRTLFYASGFAAVLMLLGAYIGWQATPYGAFPIASLVAVYGVTLVIACYLALAYLPQVTRGQPLGYEALFANAWRILLVTGLSVLMVLGVYALMALCAALFGVLGIDAFGELFARPWFVLLVGSLAFGVGVLACRRRIDLIDAAIGLLEGLTRYLLPLVLVIVVVFLCTLPVVGLQPLWDTGNGTAILLALNAVALVLVNAVYQAGRDAPYGPLVHRLMSVGIALLPLVSALAVYGVALRVAQYGWTVERCWALTAAVLFALLSVGYAAAVVWRRAGWPAYLAPFNTVMGGVVIGVLLLANSPLLDFRSIAVASQLARIESGEIVPAEFDFRYARTFLARPGYLRTRPLVAELGVDPGKPGFGGFVFAAADAADRARHEDLWGTVEYRPEAFPVPAGLRATVEQIGTFVDDPVLVELDLDQDGEMEYALLGAHCITRPNFESLDLGVGIGIGIRSEEDEQERVRRAFAEAEQVVSCVPTGFVIRRVGGDWKHKYLRLRMEDLNPGKPEAEVVGNALRQGLIETIAPELDDFRVGEYLFDISDSESWRAADSDLD